MYQDALPLRKAATKKYYGHDGAFYPETMFFWGNYTDVNYGFDRQGKPDGLADNTYIRYYWQGGLELVGMMLDYYDCTRDTFFLNKTLLPLTKEITCFFDQHWKRGADAKFFIHRQPPLKPGTKPQTRLLKSLGYATCCPDFWNCLQMKDQKSNGANYWPISLKFLALPKTAKPGYFPQSHTVS